MTSEALKVGGEFTWSSMHGKVNGSVKKKLTKPMNIKTHHVAASPYNPQLLVESDRSGKVPAHKPAALKKVKAKISSDEPDAATSVKAFKDAVNMSAKALTAWLATDKSKKVGFKAHEGEESVGHQSGKKIVALLGKTQTRFTSSDVAHARKVVGYIHRHLAQRPAGDISETHWRYSLMNWGHDPQKSKP